MNFFKRLFGDKEWDDIPRAFVSAVREKLGDEWFRELLVLSRRCGLTKHDFFSRPERLGADPERLEWAVSDLAEVLFFIGNALAKREQFDDAEKAFRLSLRLHPEDMIGNHRSLAFLYAATNRTEAAAEYARIALDWMDRVDQETRYMDPALVKGAADRFPGISEVRDESRKRLLDIVRSSGEMRQTIMCQRLQLPPVEVQGAEAELWTIIKGPDKVLADQTYDRTLRLLKSPSAAIAYKILDGVSRLTRRLNLLIALNRALILLAVGAIIAAIVWSYWLFLVAFGLGALWHLVTNRRQTAANVHLGATIIVCFEKMVTDTDFRSRALDLLRRRRGTEFADAVESFLDRAPEAVREWILYGSTTDET